MNHVLDTEIWSRIRDEASHDAAQEPALASFLNTVVLSHESIEDALSYILASKLGSPAVTAVTALTLPDFIDAVFAVDIHPGARIGEGILFDHATSVVIGETAVIDDDFSMLHEVTLGGTGKVGGDRHPKIRRRVMIVADATVLGNIVVGEGAKIGAGSFVVEDVPPHGTVAGVPARQVGYPAHALPALEMDQSIEQNSPSGMQPGIIAMTGGHP